MKREVARHAGRTIKTEGDGLIASFVSIRAAVDCAVTSNARRRNSANARACTRRPCASASTLEKR